MGCVKKKGKKKGGDCFYGEQPKQLRFQGGGREGVTSGHWGGI